MKLLKMVVLTNVVKTSQQILLDIFEYKTLNHCENEDKMFRIHVFFLLQTGFKKNLLPKTRSKNQQIQKKTLIMRKK